MHTARKRPGQKVLLGCILRRRLCPGEYTTGRPTSTGREKSSDFNTMGSTRLNEGALLRPGLAGTPRTTVRQ